VLYDGAVFLKDFKMNKTEIKLQYSVCKNNENSIPVIIVAAGSSTRMKGVNKQFLSILGVPVIARTLMAFERCEYVSKIIIVTSQDSISQMQLLCEKYSIDKLCDIVEGGANRHESVMKGIERLDTNDTKVLIHDGARPFVDTPTISQVVMALYTYDAALCVCKINDTVKKISDDGVVLSTVDRSKLYAAQTPQGVDVVKYKNACETIVDVQEFTDDASIMEAAGYNVKAVVSSSKNIKITTRDDIAIAESIATGEGEL